MSEKPMIVRWLCGEPFYGVIEINDNEQVVILTIQEARDVRDKLIEMLQEEEEQWR